MFLRPSSLALALILSAAACTDFMGPGGPPDDGMLSRAVAVPVPAASGLAAAAVSSGFFHTCALTPAGQAMCWGQNIYSQLGADAPEVRCNQGVWECIRRPVAVSGGHTFTKVVAGQFAHTCALEADGSAWCWGGGVGVNGFGWLGDGPGRESATPVRVAGGLVFADIQPGAAGTCGLTADGVVYCWGPNYHGEVGDGTKTSRETPVPVSGSLRFRALGVGGSHACGIAVDGLAWCWGSNRWGAIGAGQVPYNNFGASATKPTKVAGGHRFTALASGGDYTCGLAEDGTARCWGYNSHGQLGDGGNESHSGVPTTVAGGLKFTRLTAGTVHACGLTAGGEAYCWGSDWFGGLGDGGPLEERHTPVKVKGPAFADISAGGSHTCAVTADRKVWCWGDRYIGQHGNG